MVSEDISSGSEGNEYEAKDTRSAALGPLAGRSCIGGALMGLANLVPGISGGTMLLAAGIYPDFINAIAEVTTLRLKFRPMLVLVCVATTAALAILLFAGMIKDLVVNHRWVMYSLFIGLTLGGVPIVWRMLGRPTKGMWIGMACGVSVMSGLFILQVTGFASRAGAGSDSLMLFCAGVVGASAMILPGVSGGYLLLVLGQYVRILSAIDKFKEAVEVGNIAGAWDAALTVGIPVGLGALAGIVGVSNLLRVLLARYRTPTLGVLLGLLLGAVIGLWPFQQGIRPEIGDTFKGQIVTTESLQRIDPEDYPTSYFRPAGTQISAAALILLAGFAITTAISRLDRNSTPGRGDKTEENAVHRSR